MIKIPFLFGLISLFMILISVIIITLSYRRFFMGDFKKILKWLLIGFYFMAIPYTFFIIREINMLDNMNEIISWIIYSLMIIVSICIFRAAMILNKFSKIVGFASSKNEKK